MGQRIVHGPLFCCSSHPLSGLCLKYCIGLNNQLEIISNKDKREFLSLLLFIFSQYMP